MSDTPPDVPFEQATPADRPPAPPPASRDAETALIGCCLLDGESTADLCTARGVTHAAFTTPLNQLLWTTITALRLSKQPALLETVSADLQSRGKLTAEAASSLAQIVSYSATTAAVPQLIDSVLQAERRRDTVHAARVLLAQAEDPSSEIDQALHEAQSRLTRASESAKGKIADRLKSRSFDLSNPPDEAPARILINARPVCSPGNITNLIAQAKAGKTAFTSALIAAAIVADAELQDRDTLGVTATAPGTLNLLHIDTEQSPFDHDQLIRLCLRRAGVATPPKWLRSYALAGFNAKDLRLSLTALLAQFSRDGGLYAVILDGAADFVDDVNDPGECNPFVAELHHLAIEHNCPIITVVHENPGQDFGKMRGHLGSQLERKAESNLRLRKTEEVTTVFSEKMRKAPILEKDGPRFKWSNADSMHVSCVSLGTTKDDAKRDKLRDFAQAVFEHLGKSSARYAEFLKSMQEIRKISSSYAEDKFGEMKRLEVLSKDLMGCWHISEEKTTP